MAKKDKVLIIRVSSEDKDFIDAVAKKLQLSSSEIALDGALKEAKRLNRKYNG